MMSANNILKIFLILPAFAMDLKSIGGMPKMDENQTLPNASGTEIDITPMRMLSLLKTYKDGNKERYVQSMLTKLVNSFAADMY